MAVPQTAEDAAAVLGLPLDASDAEVKSRFRQLAQLFHPDRNRGAAGATERMWEITAARDLLLRTPRHTRQQAAREEPPPGRAGPEPPADHRFDVMPRTLDFGWDPGGVETRAFVVTTLEGAPAGYTIRSESAALTIEPSRFHQGAGGAQGVLVTLDPARVHTRPGMTYEDRLTVRGPGDIATVRVRFTTSDEQQPEKRRRLLAEAWPYRGVLKAAIAAMLVFGLLSVVTVAERDQDDEGATSPPVTTPDATDGAEQGADGTGEGPEPAQPEPVAEVPAEVGDPATTRASPVETALNTDAVAEDDTEVQESSVVGATGEPLPDGGDAIMAGGTNVRIVRLDPPSGTTVGGGEPISVFIDYASSEPATVLATVDALDASGVRVGYFATRSIPSKSASGFECCYVVVNRGALTGPEPFRITTIRVLLARPEEGGGRTLLAADSIDVDYTFEPGPPSTAHLYMGSARNGNGATINGELAPDGTIVTAVNEDGAIVGRTVINAGIWRIEIYATDAESVTFFLDCLQASVPQVLSRDVSVIQLMARGRCA